MNRIVIVAAAALLSLGFIRSGEPSERSREAAPYRVVFDLTSRDSLNQRAVMRWIKEVSNGDPNADIEVVMYGKGFELVMPERSLVAAEVQAALKNPKITFAVCEIALKNNQVLKAQLFPGVGTVPDGIREIVDKQQADWGYIKVGT